MSERADTYRCDVCGGTFDFAWTDEEAEAERLALFGSPREASDGIVCDDCHKKFMVWFQVRAEALDERSN